MCLISIIVIQVSIPVTVVCHLCHQCVSIHHHHRYVSVNLHWPTAPMQYDDADSGVMCVCWVREGGGAYILVSSDSLKSPEIAAVSNQGLCRKVLAQIESWNLKGCECLNFSNLKGMQSDDFTQTTGNSACTQELKVYSPATVSTMTCFTSFVFVSAEPFACLGTKGLWFEVMKGMVPFFSRLCSVGGPQ